MPRQNKTTGNQHVNSSAVDFEENKHFHKKEIEAAGCKERTEGGSCELRLT